MCGVLVLVQLLSCTSLVNANHGDTNGPSSIPNAESEVAVVRIDVSSLLRCVNNLDNGLENAVREIELFQFLEQRPHVFASLYHGGVCLLTLVAVLHICISPCQRDIPFPKHHCEIAGQLPEDELSRLRVFGYLNLYLHVFLWYELKRSGYWAVCQYSRQTDCTYALFIPSQPLLVRFAEESCRFVQNS